MLHDGGVACQVATPVLTVTWKPSLPIFDLASLARMVCSISESLGRGSEAAWVVDAARPAAGNAAGVRSSARTSEGQNLMRE